MHEKRSNRYASRIHTTTWISSVLNCDSSSEEMHVLTAVFKNLNAFLQLFLLKKLFLGLIGFHWNDTLPWRGLNLYAKAYLSSWIYPLKCDFCPCFPTGQRRSHTCALACGAVLAKAGQVGTHPLWLGQRGPCLGHWACADHQESVGRFSDHQVGTGSQCQSWHLWTVSLSGLWAGWGETLHSLWEWCWGCCHGYCSPVAESPAGCNGHQSNPSSAPGSSWGWRSG